MMFWDLASLCVHRGQQEGACVQDFSPMLCPHTHNLKCQSHDRPLQHQATTNSQCLSSTLKKYTKSSKDIQFCYFASNFLSGSENPTMHSPISSSGFPEACTFALQKSGMEIFQPVRTMSRMPFLTFSKLILINLKIESEASCISEMLSIKLMKASQKCGHTVPVFDQKRKYNSKILYCLSTVSMVLSLQARELYTREAAINQGKDYRYTKANKTC